MSDNHESPGAVGRRSVASANRRPRDPSKHRRPSRPTGWLAWSGALAVLVLTASLVAVDISVSTVNRYWSRHSFTSSVVAGLLVLLLTLLIVDRVARIRRVRDQARAVAVQAAVVLGQAVRATDAVRRAPRSVEDREEASEELRTYTQMLLISAPLLIDERLSRAFLDAAQRVAVRLSRALRDSGDAQSKQANAILDDRVADLRHAAAPVLEALDSDQRTAFHLHEGDRRVTFDR